MNSLWIGNVSEALFLVYGIFILQALFNSSSSLEAVDKYSVCRN